VPGVVRHVNDRDNEEEDGGVERMTKTTSMTTYFLVGRLKTGYKLPHIMPY